MYIHNLISPRNKIIFGIFYKFYSILIVNVVSLKKDFYSNLQEFLLYVFSLVTS